MIGVCLTSQIQDHWSHRLAALWENLLDPNCIVFGYTFRLILLLRGLENRDRHENSEVQIELWDGLKKDNIKQVGKIMWKRTHKRR